MEDEVSARSENVPNPKSRSSLIFISHDTRDAEIAEAFGRLLSSVSAGVLKSFRSSDKKGNQGIEYGVEWYPEIMKKLDIASDVVCLLTPNSLNRPWILYEAGVAKGKLNVPVHGLALGVPLTHASSGPFAQFQNSDDSEDALTQLVMQLVKRIPNAEPDRDVVVAQVSNFKAKLTALLEASQEKKEDLPDAQAETVAKTFEEIKVMFQDLPTRLQRRFDRSNGSDLKRRTRFAPEIIYRACRTDDGEFDGLSLLIITSALRDEIPWLYDCAQALQACDSSSPEIKAALLERFERMIKYSERSYADREYSKEYYMFREELLHMLRAAISDVRRKITSS